MIHGQCVGRKGALAVGTETLGNLLRHHCVWRRALAFCFRGQYVLDPSESQSNPTQPVLCLMPHIQKLRKTT